MNKALSRRNGVDMRKKVMIGKMGAIMLTAAMITTMLPAGSGHMAAATKPQKMTVKASTNTLYLG